MLIGKGLIGLAFVSSLLSLIAFFLTSRGRERWRVIGRTTHIITTLAAIGAAGWLMHLILTHQFQFSYVYRYSSRDLPLHFLVSTFWAGQEGTFLMWALFSAVLGVVVMYTAKQFEAGVMTFMLLLQNFLFAILLKLSPFALYNTVPPDGAGLNPLLQDYWMVIHPPILFTGFAAFTIPAAFAMHAMLRKDTDEWVKGALPWTAFGVLILGTGICLGGYWAYRTLGWGGYWGWDPVENSSFVPWLVGVALLHGLVVQTHRGLLKRLNLFLAVLAFMLVQYSTFLTRSGVLGDFSVHSFVDLGINGFLIAFVASYAILGFGLYFWRLRGIKEDSFPSALWTREYGMFLGSLSIMLFGILVLLGTSAPLISRLFGPPSNVSTAYYKAVSVPLGILLSLGLAHVPVLFWKKPREESIVRLLLVPGILSGVATAVLFLVGMRRPQYMLLVFSAGLALFVNLGVVIDTIRRNWARAGGYLVHVGVGLMLIGIVTSTIYSRSESVVMPKGQPVQALGYTFVWKGERPVEEGKKKAYDIQVAGPDGHSFMLSPIMFYSAYNNGVMRRPAIKRFARNDLYLSPQGVDREEALDKMDKHDFTLARGDTIRLAGSLLRFDSFDAPTGRDPGRIEIVANLTQTGKGKTEKLSPSVTATSEGQVYSEALSTIDGARIVVRRVDPASGRAQFYVREPGSAHYDLPIEALYLEATVKPYIMILWVGTFLAIGGLLMTVIYRARTAQMQARSGTKPARVAEVAARPAEKPAVAVGA